MSLWQKFLRAEYQWQPAQLFRRAWRVLRLTFSDEAAVIRLPWGMPITVNPRDSIGRSIVALNTLDLPVTEAIWRLLDEDATCADIGANIGYMTSVMAARLRAGGIIHSFEPVPELAKSLENHARVWQSLSRAKIRVHRLASADKNGPGQLYLPHGYAENCGLGMLLSSPRSREGMVDGRTVMAQCERLDETLADVRLIDLMKIDVEGCEHQVLEGAEGLLRESRIRDIVFEEYNPAPTASSIKLLRDHGYHVFLIARSFNGPVILPADARQPDELDPPTYLATIDVHRARLRFAARGWRVFTVNKAPGKWS